LAKFNLDNRESRVLVVGAAIVVVMVVYLGMQGPWDTYQNAAKQVDRTEKRLREAQSIHQRVAKARNAEALVREQLAGQVRFDLLAFVNRAVVEGGLSARAVIGNPSRNVTGSNKMSEVQVELKGVSVAEFIDLLHRIYGSGQLVVLHDMTSLGPSFDGRGLDCRMIFLAPRL